MEIEVRLQVKRVGWAITLIEAGSKAEVISALREELDSAEAGDSSWLDGFDEGDDDDV
jgi:hypothetical protein